MRNARRCYHRWGALGKVRQLDERYPHLHEERDPTSPIATIGTSVGQLDAETVVKASQALSGEIDLPKLIEKRWVQKAYRVAAIAMFFEIHQPIGHLQIGDVEDRAIGLERRGIFAVRIDHDDMALRRELADAVQNQRRAGRLARR